MAESFFKRLSNDVLEATEQVANRMEEGLALLFNGGEPDRSNAGQIPASTDNNPFQGADDDHDQENLEEEFRNHPLQGIADSVVGDILSGQVGRWRVPTCLKNTCVSSLQPICSHRTTHRRLNPHMHIISPSFYVV